MSLGFKKSQLGGAREPRAQMVTVPPRGPGPERSCPLPLARSWPFPFPAASVIPQGGAGPPAFSAMRLLPSLRVMAGPPRGLRSVVLPAPHLLELSVSLLQPVPRPSRSSHPSGPLQDGTCPRAGVPDWPHPPGGYRAAPDAGEGLGSGIVWVRTW